jgi:hypothetical protein
MGHSDFAATSALRAVGSGRRRIIRRALSAAVVLAIGAAGLVTAGVVTATGASAATRGSILVLPATNLVSHQVVSVVGSGWDPGASVGWCEGVPSNPPPDQKYCNANGIVLGTADTDGNFSGQLEIVRFLHVFPNNHLVDCADPAVACVVGAGDQSDVAGTAVTKVIKFATLPRTIFPGNGSAVEGNSGTSVVKVPVRLSKAQTKPVTVQWTTQYAAAIPGLQATPNVDYTPASGTVTFAAGQTLKLVSITVNGDTAVEPDEYIAVAFTHPVNAVMGGFWGIGFAKIVNDD